MGQTKHVKGKLIFKHQTEAEWHTSNNGGPVQYTPAFGEKVLYDPDEKYSYTRVKYGDGEHIVAELPFSVEQVDWEQEDLKQAGYIVNKPPIEGNEVGGLLQKNQGNINYSNGVAFGSNNQVGAKITYVNAIQSYQGQVGAVYVSTTPNNTPVVGTYEEISGKYTPDYSISFGEYDLTNTEFVLVKNNQAFVLQMYQDHTFGHGDACFYLTGTIDEQIFAEPGECYFYLPGYPNWGVDNNPNLNALVIGEQNISLGANSFVGGVGSIAKGEASHAEGNGTIATGDGAHTEGKDTQAKANNAHAEGYATEASGTQSHAEGTHTRATKSAAHAEGYHTTASGGAAHAEGAGTTAEGQYAHAEGESSSAKGLASHAEGYGTITGGSYTSNTLTKGAATAVGSYAHAEGNVTIATGVSSHAEGCNTFASSTNAHAEGYATVASASHTHAEGNNTTASASAAHSEGYFTTATGGASHAEGANTFSNGSYSHSEGRLTIAQGTASHAEGNGQAIPNNVYSGVGENYDWGGKMLLPLEDYNVYNIASGEGAHVEGVAAYVVKDETWYPNSSSSASTYKKLVSTHPVTASGKGSHAEGIGTIAQGQDAHAEGYFTKAIGSHSHASGNATIATGSASFAIGHSTEAKSPVSFASGSGTIASAHSQTAIGKYNQENNNALFIVGNGSSDTSRSNAFEILNNGNVVVNGDLTVNGTSTTINTINENVQVSQNTITLRYDAETGLKTDELTGIIAHNYDGENNGVLAFDQNGTAYVGDEGDLQPLMTREASEDLVDGSILKWDAESLKAVKSKIVETEGGISLSGDTTLLEGAASGVVIEGSGHKISEGYPPLMNSHVEGNGHTASGSYNHVEGKNNILLDGDYNHIEGSDNTTAGIVQNSHIEGDSNTVVQPNEIASIVKAIHLEGANNTVQASYTHAEGHGTTASGEAAHSEGEGTTASGDYSHAGGLNSTAIGEASFAHGIEVETLNDNGVVFGNNNQVGVKGFYYTAVDFTNKLFELSTIQPVNFEAIRKRELILPAIMPTIPYKAGDILNIVNDAKYDCKMKIVSVGENVIQVDNIPFEALVKPEEWSKEDASIYAVCREDENGDYVPVNMSPEGAVDIGKYTQFSAGGSNKVPGRHSAAFGIWNTVAGDYALAEGWNNVAVTGSHAEGSHNKSLGNFGHAEGGYNKTTAWYTHAEGYQTEANGEYSHAEGEQTTASSQAAHAEGQKTTSSGTGSHAEGQSTKAEQWSSHAEGYLSRATGGAAHAEGINSQVLQDSTLTENNLALLPNNLSKGGAGHAEGYATLVTGIAAHSEGLQTFAKGDYSHAEGRSTKALGSITHAEGFQTEATGDAWGSHVEGYLSKTTKPLSHAEGVNTRAEAIGAHAEGGSYEGGVYYAGGTANGMGAHAEGIGTIASGQASHAEGGNTKALHKNSHASGSNTVTARENQTVIGEWNAEDSEALFVVGQGVHDGDRRNAFSVGGMVGHPSIKIGNTELTEAQLAKLIRFLDTIEI